MLLTEGCMQNRDMTEKKGRMVAIFIGISQESVQFHRKNTGTGKNPVFQTGPKRGYSTRVLEYVSCNYYQNWRPGHRNNKYLNRIIRKQIIKIHRILLTQENEHNA